MLNLVLMVGGKGWRGNKRLTMFWWRQDRSVESYMEEYIGCIAQQMEGSSKRGCLTYTIDFCLFCFLGGEMVCRETGGWRRKNLLDLYGMEG